MTQTAVRKPALKEEWPWVKAIGDAVRLTIHADGRETHDILSRDRSGQRFGEAVRGHRGIESIRTGYDASRSCGSS